MPFTLSAATTIDGITNSYEVTGSGNLDELATACSTIGMTRAGGVITFNPGINRILAVSGTLTETRTGTRTILIRGSGHICFAYATGSVTTLGVLTSGVYRGGVDIVYEDTAMMLDRSPYNTARGKCFAGLGTFTFVNGSMAYHHSQRSHMDVWQASALVSFDNVRLFLNAFDTFAHIWNDANRTTTTSKTVFIFQNKPMEGGRTITTVQTFFIDTGFRWLSALATDVLRVLQPQYAQVDTATNPNPSCVINVIDPVTPWMGAAITNHLGIKRVWRTIRTTFTDPLGVAISGAKLVVRSSTNAISQANFTGAAAAIELLQSTRASGVNHDANGATGTGYTDEGNYDAHAVGFGYAASRLAINLRTSASGNAGVLWSVASAKSSLVTTAYASVGTAGMSLSTTGAGTLTITGAVTTKQVAEYLFKLAYDNADTAFWRGLAHTPATPDGAAINFGSIGFVIAAGGALTGADLKTTGAIALTGGIVTGLTITGNVTQTTPTNLSGVTITGNLTYNQATNLTITLTDTTITGTVSNSGAGVVSISPAGSTSVGTAGANVTVLPVPHTITFEGLPENTEVRIRRGSKTIVQAQDVVGGTFVYSFDADDKPVSAQFTLPSYVFEDINFTLSAVDQSFTIVSAPDPSYSNS